MGLWWQSPLACSINKGAGLGTWLRCVYKPPPETLAASSSRPNSEALAACMVLEHPHAAFHPCTCGLHKSVAVVAAVLIGYDHVEVVAETTTRRRRSRSTTFSTPMCDNIGLMFQLFFRCSARLVVRTIYDPFTCKFTRCNGRCNTSVAYPLPYT
jgi:hypothetical protein